MDAYSAANAFVADKFAVHGDIFSAIRFFSSQPHSIANVLWASLATGLERLRTYSVPGQRKHTAENIQFHYDRSNEFYAQFLDSQMVYSSAYFRDRNTSLEEAQTEKLDQICRDLELKPGDRFLEIGCGWGALLIHAARYCGVTALGCTLSNEQLEFVRELVRRHDLAERVRIEAIDYRDLAGSFDKIASVGMFEHVGAGHLAEYFKKVYSLLNGSGLFVNRGVIRPEGISDGPDTLFLQKHVFPGSKLVHLGDVVRHGERAGFEVRSMDDLRKHYALTCRAWVKNLQQHADTCCALVGKTTYKTWLLYLAASTVAFEDGRTSAAQVLFAKQ